MARIQALLWRGLILALIASHAWISTAQSPPTGDRIIVPEGTDVKLKLLEALSSKTAHVGDPVALELADDLRVDGVVVVRKGAKARGEITVAKKSGRMGKAGDVALQIDYLRAGDVKIRLRGTKGAEGDSAVGRAIVLTAVSGLGIMKHGKDAEVPEGTQLTAFVFDDTSVLIAPPLPSVTPAENTPAPHPATDSTPPPTGEVPSSPPVNAPPPSNPTASTKPAVVCDRLRQPQRLDRSTHESIELGVMFGDGNTEVVHLSNADKKDASVTIERYAATGCMVETLEKIVPAAEKADVRLDLSQPHPDIGWMRVLSKGKAVSVSTTYESLRGNVLVSVPHDHLGSRGPTGRIMGIHHRWRIDQAKHNAFFAFFVNLSDYPVQVGICRSDHPNVSCRTLNHTVAPWAQIGFRISPSDRYLTIESEPGYSASTAIHLTDGEKQVFNASSSITF